MSRVIAPVVTAIALAGTAQAIPEQGTPVFDVARKYACPVQ
jgi:hypothetical protein